MTREEALEQLSGTWMFDVDDQAGTVAINDLVLLSRLLPVADGVYLSNPFDSDMGGFARKPFDSELGDPQLAPSDDDLGRAATDDDLGAPLPSPFLRA